MCFGNVSGGYLLFPREIPENVATWKTQQKRFATQSLCGALWGGAIFLFLSTHLSAAKPTGESRQLFIDNLKVHGFLSQGIVNTSDNRWFGDSPDTSYSFTEAALKPRHILLVYRSGAERFVSHYSQISCFRAVTNEVGRRHIRWLSHPGLRACRSHLSVNTGASSRCARRPNKATTRAIQRNARYPFYPAGDFSAVSGLL
jgi:hypothetical protein